MSRLFLKKIKKTAGVNTPAVFFGGQKLITCYGMGDNIVQVKPCIGGMGCYVNAVTGKGCRVKTLCCKTRKGNGYDIP